MLRRICANLKPLDSNVHPLPTVDETFAQSRVFIKFNGDCLTHNGSNKLSFGISSDLEYFQKRLNKI